MCSTLSEEEKIQIKSSDDLPRITYEVSDVPSVVLGSDVAVMEIASKVKADIKAIMEKYDIQDKGTIKGYLADLRNIAILEGDYDSALEYNLKVRNMQDKPADKLTSGLSTDSLLNALKDGKEMGSEDLLKAFKKDYSEKVIGLPWEVVQDNIESSKGSMENV